MHANDIVTQQYEKLPLVSFSTSWFCRYTRSKGKKVPLYTSFPAHRFTYRPQLGHTGVDASMPTAVSVTSARHSCTSIAISATGRLSTQGCASYGAQAQVRAPPLLASRDEVIRSPRASAACRDSRAVRALEKCVRACSFRRNCCDRACNDEDTRPSGIAALVCASKHCLSLLVIRFDRSGSVAFPLVSFH